MSLYTGGLIGAALVLIELCGIAAALSAVLHSRTPQGSIAWGISLIAIPVIALPLWLVLGRSKFNGMVNARRANDNRLEEISCQVRPWADRFVVDVPEEHGNARVLTELTHLPFLRSNQARLLVDGDSTFEAMFAAIDEATRFVVAEFFIVNDDQLGRRFQQTLIAAARRGCQVYLLFDEVGSQRITRSYLGELREAGVHVSGMKAARGLVNRFQINFRNHRKIVVVDGHTALVGGHNVGDEYVHRHPRLTPWRDTHLQIEGPAALAAQLAFAEDWLWATGSLPQLDWKPRESPGDEIMFVFPSGPDDQFETCGLFFTHLINAARDRLWIASPYFVPDQGIVTALQLAAMRGVDVRIMIPGLADKWLVKRAAMAYVADVAASGVRMYEYDKGFLHQKVAIIDDQVSVIGTANFDNRSFRLNFEISVVTIDEAFQQQVAGMLQDDFENCTLLDPAELANRSLFFHASSRVARLFAPVL